jgi:hypothetical protein
LVDQANGIYNCKLAWFKSDGFDHVSERNHFLDGVCDGIDDEDQIRDSTAKTSGQNSSTLYPPQSADSLI